MAEHDPADMEWMARLLCVADGIDPAHWVSSGIVAPRRALDYMAARGEKVTTRDSIQTPYSSEGWDAAPLTPRKR